MTPLLWLAAVVIVPVLVAIFVTRRCGAPTEEGDACRNPQPGPWRRCHLHEGDSSSRDWIFLALLLVAVLGGVWWVQTYA